MSDRILGVIFDLDGVIVSTDNAIYRPGNAWPTRKASILTAKSMSACAGSACMESLEIILERAQRPYTGDEKQAMAARKNAILCGTDWKPDPCGHSAPARWIR